MTPRSSFAIAAAGLVLSLGSLGEPPTELVTINPNIRHQTIQGWGATHSLTRDLNFMSQETVDQMIEESVNDLGLTFLRVGFGLLSEPYNDNGNAGSINWSGFHDGGSIDRDVVRGLGRFAAQVRANGETPVFLFAKDWEFSAPAWMTDAEFAEHMTANMLYFKNQHGIDITFAAIDNEPAYFDPYTPERQLPIIKTLGPMLQANGLATKIALNEGLNASSTWSYITEMQSDAAVWPHIGLLNWHLYGANDPFRSQIRDFGKARGIPTGMTEFVGAQVSHLVDDLTLGGVSYWTRYFTAERGAGAVAGGSNYFAAPFDGTSFLKNHTYFQFRQFMRYVRPGAVRLETTSSTPAIRAMAFERAGSRVAVLVNTSGSPVEVTVQGLAGGRYGVSQTVGRNFSELGIQDIGGSITVTVAGNGVLTIYPASTNQRPVANEWGASPSFVTLPATTTLLSVSASDTERDALNYEWAVKSKPAGAPTFLGSPGSASTVATGLSVPGTYVFTVTVRDNSGNTTARDVTVRAYQGNQPPVIDEGNRYFKQEWIVQPRSSQTYGPLFITAFDLEGDPVTTSFSVVNQPAGANASFSGTTVSGMTVPGDYTFRFTASDPTHSVFRDFTRRVVPAEPAPVPVPVPGCRFDLNAGSQSLPSGGGTGTVAVSTGSGCAWSATTRDSWISITSGASSTGTGTVTFSVSANIGEARLGAITIADKAFTVAQAAPTHASCSLSINPASQSVGATANTPASFSVTAGTGCAWTATTLDSWIAITSGATGTGNGVVSFTVGANSGSARAGTIGVAGILHTVNQAAAPVDPSDDPTDPPVHPSTGRRRPTADLKGRAVARGSDRAQTSGKSSLEAPAKSVVAGGTGLARTRLTAFLTSMLAADETIERIQVMDLDDDGELDVVMVEMIDGAVWRWERR